MHREPQVAVGDTLDQGWNKVFGSKDLARVCGPKNGVCSATSLYFVGARAMILGSAATQAPSREGEGVPFRRVLATDM